MGTGVLRVVSLNMDSLFGPRWLERRQEIVSWLDELAPDVVCLQEVWEDHRHPNTGGWIAEHLADDWHWDFGGFAPPDLEAAGAHPSVRFGSAILSRWPIDVVELIELPVSTNEEDRPHVAMKVPFVPPGVSYELLHVRTAGIDVYSTHLQSSPGQTAHRVRQVLLLDEKIGRTCDPSSGLPPILCGDFNADPSSDVVRFLTGDAVIDGRSTYFQDAWSIVHGAGGATWDPANPMAADAGDLYPRRIDYVFVGDRRYRKDGAGRVLSASLAFDRPMTETYASDHYGLSVDVAWPTRPGNLPDRRS